jgi:transcriptional repressor NrdR
VLCPYCGGDSQVVDSRVQADGVRRRRTCNQCRRRFTTYEKAGSPAIKVGKRDGSSQPFDPAKVARVLRRVGRDRPGLSPADAIRLARALEAQLVDAGVRQIRSGELVERLLGLLGPVDPIARDRLAANYLDESGALRTEPRGPETSAGQLGLFAVDTDDDD